MQIPSLETSNVQYDLALPETYKSRGILPTPMRTFMRSNREVSMQTGYVGGETTSIFKPILSVMEKHAELVDNYTRKTEELVERRSQYLVKTSDSFRLEFDNRAVNSKIVYIELGGQEIFFDYHPNYISAYELTGSKTLNIPISSIAFATEPSKADRIQYRFFILLRRIVDFDSNRVRMEYKNRKSDYHNLYTRHSTANGIVTGLSEKLNGAREAFVFSTCVEFRSLDASNLDLNYDETSKCWIYDLKQQTEILPLIPGLSADANGRSYLIEKHMFTNGTRQSQFTLTNQAASSLTDLKGAQWQSAVYLK